MDQIMGKPSAAPKNKNSFFNVLTVIRRPLPGRGIGHYARKTSVSQPSILFCDEYPDNMRKASLRHTPMIRNFPKKNWFVGWFRVQKTHIIPISALFEERRPSYPAPDSRVSIGRLTEELFFVSPQIDIQNSNSIRLDLEHLSRETQLC